MHENQNRLAEVLIMFAVIIISKKEISKQKTHKDFEGHGFVSIMQSDIPERFSHFDLLGLSLKSWD